MIIKKDQYGLEDISVDSYPRPVLVSKANVTKGVGIAITGRQLANGKTIPMNQLVKPVSNDGEVVVVKGKVIWPGHSLENSIVQIYEEATMINPIKHFGRDLNGAFDVPLPAQSYYFLVNVDSDGDGKYSAGDAIGGFGTDDIINIPPSLVKLGEEKSTSIEITISAT